jgi:hypothetical protein
MTTLVIHAPSGKARLEDKRSFDDTFKYRVGDRYAIDRNSYRQLDSGCDVVLLDKDTKRRAEGTLVRLEEAGSTETGMLRYNVHIENLRMMQYKPERLTRCGIAVME